MSSGVSIFPGVLPGVGVADGLDAAVGVGVDTGDAFFIGLWECGSAKETPAQATKTARVAADWTLAFNMAARGHRRFLAIMVAIFGGFEAEFSGLAAENLSDCPDQACRRDPGNGIAGKAKKTPTSGGKLVGALRLRRGGYATRPCFFKRKMEPA